MQLFIRDRESYTFLLLTQVLPVVIFFSAFVYMIYYLGIMQVVITKIAWLMQISMGTSAAESLNAAGNIFIGQVSKSLFSPISFFYFLFYFKRLPSLLFSLELKPCSFF